MGRNSYCPVFRGTTAVPWDCSMYCVVPNCPEQHTQWHWGCALLCLSKTQVRFWLYSQGNTDRMGHIYVKLICYALNTHYWSPKQIWSSVPNFCSVPRNNFRYSGALFRSKKFCSVPALLSMPYKIIYVTCSSSNGYAAFVKYKIFIFHLLMFATSISVFLHSFWVLCYNFTFLLSFIFDLC